MKTHSIVFLAMFALTIIVFGCTKTPPNYTSGIAGMHQCSGIDVYVDSNSKFDTIDTTFYMNIVALNNSTIAFTNFYWGSETLNEHTTNKTTKATLFVYQYVNRNSFGSGCTINDSLTYYYSNDSIVWHDFNTCVIFFESFYNCR